MNIFQKILSGLNGGLIKEIGEVADRFITTKQEKEAFKAELEARARAFEREVMQHEKELIQADNQDRANAREREVKLQNSLGVWVQNVGAAVAIAAFVGLVYLLTLKPIELSERQVVLVDMLLGTLTAIIIQLYQYWFGSSEGSRRKDTRNGI